jgi:hypothetical protein
MHMEKVFTLMASDRGSYGCLVGVNRQGGVK